MSNTIQNDESPISNLKIYNKVTPLLLISLGSLYISILIFRYLKWRYRKRKAKKFRIERQKLEKFWREKAATAHIKSKVLIIQRPPASYGDERDSTATLVVVSGGGESVSQQDPLTTTISVQEDDKVVMILPYHMRHHNTMIHQKQQQQQQGNNNSFKRKRDEWVGKLTNRIDGNYQRKKRRQLLWQWSVAMGYCRYNHGYHLDAMINRLLVVENRK